MMTCTFRSLITAQASEPFRACATSFRIIGARSCYLSWVELKPGNVFVFPRNVRLFVKRSFLYFFSSTRQPLTSNYADAIECQLESEFATKLRADSRVARLRMYHIQRK
jgi:hypothetical protein